MDKKTVYLFVFDGFSDWEPAYAAAEINQSAGYRIATFALTKEPVTSAGGLTLLPDLGPDDLTVRDAALIILPGGKDWEAKKLREVSPLIREFHAHRVPVAAICGATILLADLGLLDHRAHTSNGPEFLGSHSSSYHGAAYYQERAAVRADHIITANGTAPIEFAREILLLLNIYDEATTEEWYRLFKYGITKS